MYMYKPAEPTPNAMLKKPYTCATIYRKNIRLVDYFLLYLNSHPTPSFALATDASSVVRGVTTPASKKSRGLKVSMAIFNSIFCLRTYSLSQRRR